MKITRFILIALMWLLLPLMSNAGGVSEKQSTGNQREIGAAAEREESRPGKHGSRHSKPPKTPRSPRAEAVSPFQIILTWSDHSDNEAGFKIERSTDGRRFSQIAQVQPNITVYRDTDRFPGTRYCYRVRAFNSAGASAFSKTAQARTHVSSCALSIAALHSYGQYLLPGGSSHWVAIAAGRDHGLALRSDRTVAGWSIGFSNDAAQIPPDLKNVVAIAAGGAHSLALRRDGTVTGWGSNEHGASIPPPGLCNVAAIAAGTRHSLALKSDGTVVGWGHNWQGAATPPPGLDGVVAIAAGDFFSLALRSDGRVVGWGYNVNDQATPPWDLTNVIAIAAGGQRGLALKSDGTVVAWGAEDVATTVPPETPALTGIVAIAEGSHTSAALKQDGTVVTWRYDYGWLPAMTLEGVVAISANDSQLVTLSTAPNPSSIIQATVTASNRVHLSWEDVSAGRHSFEIERALESGLDDWVHIGQTTKGTTSFDDTTVNTGDAYRYQIRARNDCHISAPSNWEVVRISAPSTPPYNFQVIAHADQAQLTGGSYGDGATGYSVERAPDTDDGPGTWSPLVTANFPPLSHFFDCTDTGLTVNSNYWYRACVFNAMGVSPFCAPVRIQIVPPMRPDQPYVNIGASNSVHLQWSAMPPDDQDTFIVERSTNTPAADETWIVLATITNKHYSRDYSDTDVNVDATYRYRIRTFNVLGVSPPSLEAGITINAPPAPLLGGEAFATSVKLGWYYPDYSGTTERFLIERANNVAGAPGVWKTIADVHEANQSSFTDLNLTPDTTCWYRVKTFNWAGESPYSEPVPVAIVPPSPPYITRILMGRSNVVTLSWTAPFVNALEGIFVERAPDIGGTSGSWVEISQVFTGSSMGANFEDKNATPNRTYWYRMRTFNGAGLSAYGEPFKFDVVPPLMPVLSAQQNTTNITLVFNGVEFGVMGFKLERATDSGGVPGQWTQIATVAPRSYPSVGMATYGFVMDTNLPPLVKFWYRVRSFNWAGVSPYSDPVGVTIAGPPSLSIIVSSPATFAGFRITSLILTNDSALITWSAAANTTNVVESATELDVQFMEVSPPILIQGDTGTFLHPGALTNSSPRYYRIRLVP